LDASNNLAVDESAISHDNISGVSASDHHNPVTVSNPLTEDGAQGLALQIANALTVDGSGNLAVDESGISHDNIAGVSASDHHTRYSDSEARSAIEAGTVGQVAFQNIESVPSGALGRDDSIGFLGSWGNNGNAVLWDAYNVMAGNAINISGGKGVESNPSVAVNESAISHDNIAGVSSSDHHSRPTQTTGLQDHNPEHANITPNLVSFNGPNNGQPLVTDSGTGEYVAQGESWTVHTVPNPAPYTTGGRVYLEDFNQGSGGGLWYIYDKDNNLMGQFDTEGSTGKNWHYFSVPYGIRRFRVHFQNARNGSTAYVRQTQYSGTERPSQTHNI